MSTYIALIGDLIHSRQDEDRGQTQAEMGRLFKKLNHKYQHLLASKLTITLGDEFQCLIYPRGQVWQLVDEIRQGVHWPLRLGLGYGEITTAINPDLSLGADGPAYWSAREAVNLIKTDDWNGLKQTHFMSSSQVSQVVNTILLLTDSLRADWTPAQAETFQALLAQDIYQSDFNQKDLAQRMGLSQSALSKRLTKGKIKVYLEAMETLRDLTEAIGDE